MRNGFKVFDADEHVVETFLGQKKLTKDTKRRILWANAIDFDRFPKGSLPDNFEEAAPA